MKLAFNLNYTVIDDLRGIISDEFLSEPSEKVKAKLMMIYGKDLKSVKVEDAVRDLEPWESNMRCLKSIRSSEVMPSAPVKPSMCFQTEARAGAFCS